MPGAQWMRNMANRITKRLPGGWGFVLVVFPFGEMGIGNYISNARRKEMIKGLRELADRLERKEDFGTPEEN